MKVLSHPFFYNGLQALVGAKKFRYRIVNEFIKPKKGEKVLDIGCGTGSYFNYMEEFISEYYGFDSNPAYIEHAKDAITSPKAKFFLQDLNESLVKELPSFDVIIAMGLQHHLNDQELLLFINMAKRFLAPNGRLVTMDPMIANDMNLLEYFMTRNDRGKYIRTPIEYLNHLEKSFSRVEAWQGRLSYLPSRGFISICKQ